MTDVTRRSALSLAGGALGLAACQQEDVLGPQDGVQVVSLDSDRRAPYLGEAEFAHGVASGDPLPDALVFWTRVTRLAGDETPIPVTLSVYKDRALTKLVASRPLEARPASDYTVKVDLGGLSEDTEYFYRFMAKVLEGNVYSPVGRAKTPASKGDTPVQLAVISCSNYPFGFFNVYGEIARRDDLDAVVHLGDYLYEYGPDGYGGEVGAALGREHDPAREILTLADYRRRHAQYKSDPQLQAAHAAAPWITTWDDHESANDSYRTGAENHDPETEGAWSDRKQAAVQAYLEWMPVRDPQPGRAREALWRTFNFGDVASIHCLETRLTGRSEEIAWAKELGDVAPSDIPAKVGQVMGRVGDEARTMLGAQQEAWLMGELRTSTGNGKTWQVLANQTIMARLRPPNFNETLSDEQKAAQTFDLIQALIGFSAIGAPFNLDAWDGFPAARDRLYASAKAAGARLVTLTGDTHTAWANTLRDGAGDQRGVEFGCTSVSSPGFGAIMTGVPDLGEQFTAANGEVDWHDPFGSGFTLVALSRERVKADFIKVSTVQSPDYEASLTRRFASAVDGRGMTPLSEEPI